MIETNLLTFIWNIIDLILYLEIVRCAHILLIEFSIDCDFYNQTTTMHLVFNLTISKLYSLSLLVSLNARDAWKRDASVNSHGLRSATTGDIPRITNPTRGVNVSMLRSQDTKLAVRGAPLSPSLSLLTPHPYPTASADLHRRRGPRDDPRRRLQGGPLPS